MDWGTMQFCYLFLTSVDGFHEISLVFIEKNSLFRLIFTNLPCLKNFLLLYC